MKKQITKQNHKYHTKKEGSFIYKKQKYYIVIRYDHLKDITSVNIWIVKDGYLGIRKSHFMYHTKCLNVQQHINNFIIELKEQGI